MSLLSRNEEFRKGLESRGGNGTVMTATLIEGNGLEYLGQSEVSLGRSNANNAIAMLRKIIQYYACSVATLMRCRPS